MKYLVSTALMFAAIPGPVLAQSPAGAVDRSVTAEYYYRVRWGSLAEFRQLYERNHAPILSEMQKQGFVTRIEVEEPYTHLAGGSRWDLRVRVTYRDAASAMFMGPFERAFGETAARLFPDKAKFEAEEARRFSLLEDHWDIFVMPLAP